MALKEKRDEFFQFLTMMLPVGEVAGDTCPEIRTVIFVADVRQFVYHDVINKVIGEHQKIGIEGEGVP